MTMDGGVGKTVTQPPAAANLQFAMDTFNSPQTGPSHEGAACFLSRLSGLRRLLDRKHGFERRLRESGDVRRTRGEERRNDVDIIVLARVVGRRAQNSIATVEGCKRSN